MVILWFTFTRGGDTLRGIDVPREFTNRNQAIDIIDASASTVHLQLSGSGTLLKSVHPQQVRVQIDLADATVGANHFAISPAQVSLPPGLSLKKITPAAIDITLDEIIERPVAVQVDWTGKLSEQLIMVSADVDPPTIGLIYGRQAMEETTTLFTEKVLLDGITKSGVLKERVAVQPASAKLAESGSGTVIVHYQVRPRQ